MVLVLTSREQLLAADEQPPFHVESSLAVVATVGGSPSPEGDRHQHNLVSISRPSPISQEQPNFSLFF